MGDLFLECLFWIRSVMAEICLFRHSNCTLFMYCKYDDVWPVIGTALLLVAVHDPFPPPRNDPEEVWWVRRQSEPRRGVHREPNGTRGGEGSEQTSSPVSRFKPPVFVPLEQSAESTAMDFPFNVKMVKIYTMVTLTSFNFAGSIIWQTTNTLPVM